MKKAMKDINKLNWLEKNKFNVDSLKKDHREIYKKQ